MKVACFSVAALDFFPQQNKYYAGGNSLNQAIRFRRMGHASAFVGAVGTDEAGDRLAALLQAESVDVSRMRRMDGHTARNRIINDDSGERYGVEGAWEGGVYEQFELNEADWDYLDRFDIWATHANGPDYLNALERKRSSRFMAVDFLHLKDYELLQKSLRVADIAYFGGTPGMAQELAAIAKAHRGIIVLTLGARGSIAFEGDRVYSQEALTAGKIIDTTGCGDAFQAAFTASYFATRDIRASLAAGAELGLKAALSFGGVPWR
ncbi:MAG TPA: PfkB family carbohydrate kinase [Gammaproteobacteria bacterium]|nr:PfkB family carbohydrate kinase [Gammaproteobacteria bacterium]